MVKPQNLELEQLDTFGAAIEIQQTYQDEGYVGIDLTSQIKLLLDEKISEIED